MFSRILFISPKEHSSGLHPRAPSLPASSGWLCFLVFAGRGHCSLAWLVVNTGRLLRQCSGLVARRGWRVLGAWNRVGLIESCCGWWSRRSCSRGSRYCFCTSIGLGSGEIDFWAKADLCAVAPSLADLHPNCDLGLGQQDYVLISCSCFDQILAALWMQCP